MLWSRPLVPWLVLVLVLAACADDNSADNPSETPSSTAANSPITTTMGTTTAPQVTTSTIPQETWKGAGTPESQGMESALLADLVERIDSSHPDIDAIAIVRNGTLVLDATFYPHDGDTLHEVYSVTKSIVSTLIGIAIEQGLIEGVDVPIVELLANHAPGDIDDLKASMALHDVLTMSTGLDCRDSYLYEWQGLGEMRASDDWAAHVLGLPMREEPGTRFEYCNGASHLLSTILTEATGGPALAYAHEVLFGPLGIDKVTWRQGPDSVSQGYAGIALRPADMAKIGWLYLQDGLWDGVQVLPSGWADAATTWHVNAGSAARGYGYQWWVEDDFAAAIGYGGQYILLVPEHDLVVTFVSGMSRNQSAPETLLGRYIIPAIVSEEPIPSDPAGAARLAEAIGVAAEIPPLIDLPVAAIAEELDGVPHIFADNSGGFEWFVLDFDGDALTMALEDVDGPIEVTMRFDGRFHENEAWGRVWAFRPEWTSESILTVAFRLVGDAGRGEFEFAIEDDEVRMRYREAVFGADVLATAPRSLPTLAVPDLSPPTIDGSIEPGEWDGALRTTMDDGSEVLWLHSDGYLNVAIETERGGAKNLAIAEGGRIRIFHSSAALGSAEYRLIDGEWRLARDFEWCCRVGEGGSDGLLAAEGWTANITSTGPDEQVEFRVEWPGQGAVVALSHVPSSAPPAFWPVWLNEAGEEALTGAREQVELFDVERWMVLSRADE